MLPKGQSMMSDFEIEGGSMLFEDGYVNSLQERMNQYEKVRNIDLSNNKFTDQGLAKLV